MENRELNLLENCVYFLNRKDGYRAQVLEPGESFSIHFTTREPVDTDSFCIPTPGTGIFLSILQKAETAQMANDTLSLYAQLYAFCAEVERLRKKAYCPSDGRIRRAREYMERHFREDGCLENATRESGVGARRFGELFRRLYDITPNRFLTQRKVEYAKSLLSTDSLSVAEVAELCNFSSVYYFSKVFKKETGIPPGKWK